MKNLLFFILLLTIIGCNRQQKYEDILEEADQVVENNADSARRLLMHMSDIMKYGNANNQAHYIMLMSQTGYVLYDSVPNDSLIDLSANYYKKIGNKSSYVRSLYYRAMNLYVKGNHKEALVLLKEGERIASGNRDILYMSKYHESLTMVNYEAQCNELMLKYAQLFLNDAVLLNDTTRIAHGLSHVSTALIRLHEDSEAEEYLKGVIPYLKGLDSLSRSYLLTNLACAFHSNGDIKRAKLYLNQSLEIYPRPNTYAELGDIYAEEGNLQDAEECWNNALKSDNPIIVTNTLSSIRDYYIEQNNYLKAFDISERLHHIKDSVSQASEKTLLAELQYKYDQQVIANKLQRALNWILGGSLIAILLIICILFIHHRVVTRYSRQLAESLRTIADVNRKISLLETERKERELHEGKTIEKYSKKIKALEEKAFKIHRDTYAQIGRGKQVYDEIMGGQALIYREDEICLTCYFSIFHYNTYYQWTQLYHGLTLRLIVFLILKDMGKTDEDICHILNIERGSLRSIRLRLRNQQIV
jgi:tetratricopeptide (TPR) repeat protein